jgi:hypothetical protein
MEGPPELRNREAALLPSGAMFARLPSIDHSTSLPVNASFTQMNSIDFMPGGAHLKVVDDPDREERLLAK